VYHFFGVGLAGGLGGTGRDWPSFG